jgi:hypothetical protein
MEISINFKSVNDEMPPVLFDEYYGYDYSIKCIAIVDGEVFGRSVKYCSRGGQGWVWADLGRGHHPDRYVEDLGGDESKVTHWAPWPVVVVLAGVVA